jgi:hypothetical protein
LIDQVSFFFSLLIRSPEGKLGQHGTSTPL